MPLVLPKIQKEMEASILAAMLTEFAAESGADPTSHARMAKAIAQGVSQILVSALLADAVVVGGGTLGPGKVT
jgi:hypothetical protein